MRDFATDIGKIYAWFDQESEEWFLMRYIGTSDKDTYLFRYLDDNFHMINDSSANKPVGETADIERFKEIKSTWSLLSPDGIASISNIVAYEDEEGTRILDVLSMFFPNNPSGVPDINQPFVIARQGISNIFDYNSGSVGMSVSLESLPSGYTLSDFMDNYGIISSKICNVYKTDNASDLAILLDNKKSTSILKDLYNHEIMYRKNTIPDYQYEEKEDDVINGYCNSIKTFFENTQFIQDIKSILHISTIDFKLEENKPITGEDMIVLSSLYGGIRIEKAVPLKFGYDIDLRLINMKYILVNDKDNELYIVYYTEFPDEISAKAVYKITEESTNIIQNRLRSIVKYYLESENEDS